MIHRNQAYFLHEALFNFFRVVLIPSSSVHSLYFCHHSKPLLRYVVAPLPPPLTNSSLFATHVMALCCPGLWLMAAIQPEKFPWVGASWLTQRRNSLLLSVELTEQGGAWVIVRVSVCVHAREREREKLIFVHVSKCVHIGLPLLCVKRHAWMSVSTCFKLSLKVTVCPRAGIHVTRIISRKWPRTLNTQTLQLEFFFLMDNHNLLLYESDLSPRQYVKFVWNIGICTDKLALFSDRENVAGVGDITPAYYRMLKPVPLRLMERFSF